MVHKVCRAALIGCGNMGRHHLRQIIKQKDTTEIPVICDISEESYAAAALIYQDAGLKPPPNEPDLERMLSKYPLDAAFIVTPHACHFIQAKACLEAGLDVLVEKPMVMNATEALDLIDVRDRTGKLLVVAFPGSLSPQIRAAVRMLRSGELGRLLNISGVTWQSWGPGSADTWRQDPRISGGGFLFDTGAHLLNTVVDLAGEDFIQICAWFDYNDRPVETRAAVIGRLASGALVTLNGCGEAIPSCSSEIHIFCSEAILRTGIWGERLDIQRSGEESFQPVPVPPSLGVWEQFLAVRDGAIPNPCPPEVGLRMNRLYDAICSSAADGGRLISI